MSDIIQEISTARLLLVILFFVVVLIVVVFDVWAWAVYGREATASALIHAWSKEWPLLPFLSGGVIFHLFW